ncbi:hypothetical protein QR680_009988 [Steinernema hermaphroditum]|uniref:Uncharacterized protein n=1 Tax=Steinernema hermaphroditum TaxID=289476 RepID=A0AA39INP2_9BILA|nr:hypothetical protein QR680_009988 [Steinernema hermaphroditum]
MNGDTRATAIVIASVSVFLVTLVLPVYMFITKLFFNKSQFKKHTAFWIMAHIGIIDCMFMIAIVEACIMTFSQSIVMPLLFETCSAVHIVYEWVLHFLELILALNRVVMILNLRIKFADLFFKMLAVLVWICAFAIVYLFSRYNLEMSYIFDDNAFTINLINTTLSGKQIHSVYYYSDFSAIIASFFCYLIIIVAIIFEKCRFQSVVKIDSHEMRILFQGLVTFVPGTSYWILNMIANWNFTQAPPAVNIAFTILPRLVPVFNMCGYLVLNSLVPLIGEDTRADYDDISSVSRKMKTPF